MSSSFQFLIKLKLAEDHAVQESEIHLSVCFIGCQHWRSNILIYSSSNNTLVGVYMRNEEIIISETSHQEMN